MHRTAFALLVLAVAVSAVSADSMAYSRDGLLEMSSVEGLTSDPTTSDEQLAEAAASGRILIETALTAEPAAVEAQAVAAAAEAQPDSATPDSNNNNNRAGNNRGAGANKSTGNKAVPQPKQQGNRQGNRVGNRQGGGNGQHNANRGQQNRNRQQQGDNRKQSGSAANKVCTPGSSWDAKLSMCQLCPPGKFSHNGAECASCPPDSHAPTAGSTGCKKCAHNTGTKGASGMAWCSALFTQTKAAAAGKAAANKDKP